MTLIANFVPLQDPASGPNFYQFGDDVRYEIHIDNDGDARAEITYRFRFRTVNTIPDSFLYNVGPIESLTSNNWNRRQFMTVHRVQGGQTTLLGADLPCPPCNVGPNSTPNYSSLAQAAIHDLGTVRVFAGQRAEGFYVDLGAIFDLGVLRPFANLHLSQMPQSGGINATKAKNIHTIAIQLPKTELTKGGYRPTDLRDRRSTIGVWASASRQQSRIYDTNGTVHNHGPWVQISRQAHPLINEVVIAIEDKDRWNSQHPAGDKAFADYYTQPELAGLLPVLYPGVFPHLQALVASKAPRADLVAILLTGIPSGIIAGFQNFTGPTPADLLRLNLAIPPTTTRPSNLGLLGRDLAGYPNGRRVFDDVTTIELRAIAGLTYQLVAPSYTPDPAAGVISQGLTSGNRDVTAENTVHYLPTFPYLGTPHDGYQNPPNNVPAPPVG